MSHAFDEHRRNLDSDGNWNARWWDLNATEQFLEKTECLIEQYGNYTDLKSNMSLNGDKTLSRLKFIFTLIIFSCNIDMCFSLQMKILLITVD